MRSRSLHRRLDAIEAKQAPASSRVAAASKILEVAIKAVELEDLEARIAALEQQAGAQQ